MTAPLALPEFDVAPEWIDYNGHMNDACYAVLFSRAGDALLDHLGLGPVGRAATKRSAFTLALTIRYLSEARLGDRLATSAQLLDCDTKRMRLWLEARRLSDAALVATSEQVLICVDHSGEKPRAAPFPPSVALGLRTLSADHAELPVPLDAGKGLALRRRDTFSVTP